MYKLIVVYIPSGVSDSPKKGRRTDMCLSVNRSPKQKHPDMKGQTYCMIICNMQDGKIPQRRTDWWLLRNKRKKDEEKLLNGPRGFTLEEQNVLELGGVFLLHNGCIKGY